MGSAIAIKKSVAWVAKGWKASKMIVPEIGEI